MSLVRYIDNNFGHPAIGADGEYLGAFGPPTPWRPFGGLFARNRGGGGGGGYPGPQTVFPQQMGYDADLLGADDDDIGYDEDDLEGIGAEDDQADLMGADDEVGWFGRQNRMSRLNRRQNILQSKLQSTGPGQWRRRLRLQKALQKSQGIEAKIQARIQKKQNLVAARLGVPAAVVAAGAGAAAYGVSRQRVAQADAQMQRAQAAMAEGLQGFSLRTPYEGQEVPIAFVDDADDSQIGRITVAAGAGLRETTITMTTPTISYAEFEVVGVRVHLQTQQANGPGGFDLGERLCNFLVGTVQVNGGINLLYSTVDVGQAAQFQGSLMTATAWIPGLRDNPVLQKTNTATITATFRQEITTTAAIEVSYSASLVCRRLEDAAAERQ